MKPIHNFWTDFDNAYLNKDIHEMKYVMFRVEDALEHSFSSYTWELYEALNKMSKLITKYERWWNENKN